MNDSKGDNKVVCDGKTQRQSTNGRVMVVMLFRMKQSMPTKIQSYYITKKSFKKKSI